MDGNIKRMEMQDRLEFLETRCFEQMMYIKDLECRLGIKPSERNPIKRAELKRLEPVRLPCYSYNDYRAGWRPLIMDGITGYTYDFNGNIRNGNKKVKTVDGVSFVRSVCVYKIKDFYECESFDVASTVVGEEVSDTDYVNGWHIEHGWARPYLINK